MKKIAISLLVLTLGVLLSVPAMAQITPYASMRLGTYWTSVDFNDYTPAWTTDSDDSSLMIDIADITRFGAKGQVGDIYGVVELGLVGQENHTGYEWAAYGGDDNAVYTRLIYGKWDFGGGTLTVGQDYTPVTYPSSQQGPGVFDDHANQSYDLQNGFIGVGCLWDSRIPQIRLNLDNGFHFMIAQWDDAHAEAGGPRGAAHDSPTAFQAPYTGLEGPHDGDVDVKLPKMVVGYHYKAEGLWLSPGFAYNSYEYDDTMAGGTFDGDITSWFFYLHGKVDLDGVVLNFTGHYGENLGDYGITGRKSIYSPFQPSQAYVVGDDVEDAECFGGYITAAIPVDPYTINLGWGYASQKNDDVSPTYDEADELMGYYVNCKIPIADNFTATPEFDYWDGMDNAAGQEDPDHWALGITWQMDF